MRALLLVCLAAAACSAPPPPQPAAPAPVALVRVPGLERVLGQPPAAATALLGAPGLDRSDGSGHHLQFAGAGCILDLYYYPDPAAGEPTARFAAARLRSGAADDTARCFAAQVAARG